MIPTRTRMRLWANRALRAFIRHAPFESGKWRVVRALRPLLVREALADETSYFGLRMLCDIDDWMQHQVYYFGYYNNERVHTEYFRRLLRPGQVVIDCGANVGYYTLLAAQGVQPGGSVHSFEPVERTFDRLVHNVGLNEFENVVVNRQALTNANGVATVWVAPPNNSGTSSLVAPLREFSAEERVPTERLDEYCRRAGIDSVDIVKIDVEGGEMEVLKGGESVLQRSQGAQVLIEVNRELLDRGGTSPEEVGLFMAAMGFRPHRITKHGAVLVTEVPEDNLVLFARVPVAVA